MINRVTIVQKQPQVHVQQGPIVTIQQKVIHVTVYSEELAMPIRFRKFDFPASQGQSIFQLPSIPITMIALYINGTAQNEENGDFSMNGLSLILHDGVELGDRVFGVYQEVGA